MGDIDETVRNACETALCAELVTRSACIRLEIRSERVVVGELWMSCRSGSGLVGWPDKEIVCTTDATTGSEDSLRDGVFVSLGRVRAKSLLDIF